MILYQKINDISKVWSKVKFIYSLGLRGLLVTICKTDICERGLPFVVLLVNGPNYRRCQGSSIAHFFMSHVINNSAKRKEDVRMFGGKSRSKNAVKIILKSHISDRNL
jgi:hypothetical protein